MTPRDVRLIRTTFGFSTETLARAMGVSGFTVMRWEKGSNPPTGLSLEVLDAFFLVAQKAKSAKQKKILGSRIRLGVGRLIYEELVRQ